MPKLSPLAVAPVLAISALGFSWTVGCSDAAVSPGDTDAGTISGAGDGGGSVTRGGDASSTQGGDASGATEDAGGERRDGGTTGGGEGGLIGADAAPFPDAGPGNADAEAAGDAGSNGAPGKIVGGYYPNWTPSPVRIRDVDPHYNLIYLFAATPVGGSPGTGAIEWTAPGDGMGAATNLNADIAYARQTQGRKIILSVGGAGNSMGFPDRTTSQTFVSSVASLYAQLGGFDGIDWDTYEGSDSPDTSEMIWISLQLKTIYPGFLITTPPAPWSTTDQTFCAQMAAAGALDYASPQYYDGPNLATQAYIVPSVDTWAALVGESKLVVGFGVADATNYMTVAEVVSTWNAVAANHPGLRGAFDWQIDVDQSTGWPFATQVGPLVDP